MAAFAASFRWAHIAAAVIAETLGPLMSSSILASGFSLQTECSGWGCAELALGFIKTALRAVLGVAAEKFKSVSASVVRLV